MCSLITLSIEVQNTITGGPVPWSTLIRHPRDCVCALAY
jgi:hypothetical protein